MAHVAPGEEGLHQAPVIAAALPDLVGEAAVLGVGRQRRVAAQHPGELARQRHMLLERACAGGPARGAGRAARHRASPPCRGRSADWRPGFPAPPVPRRRGRALVSSADGAPGGLGEAVGGGHFQGLGPGLRRRACGGGGAGPLAWRIGLRPAAGFLELAPRRWTCELRRRGGICRPVMSSRSAGRGPAVIMVTRRYQADP